LPAISRCRSAKRWSEESVVQELRSDYRAALHAHRQFHRVEIERLRADRARIEQSRGALDEIRGLRREAALFQRKAAAAESRRVTIRSPVC
jgi:hypothetical protein